MAKESSQGQHEDFKVGGVHAYVTLVICCLLFMVNYMDRQLISVVLEPMKKDIGLTDTQAGIIQSVFLLCIALFSFPIARLIDRWSRRKTIGIMAIVWSIFTFVTGIGRNFIQVTLPRTFVAVGEAGFSSGGTALLSTGFPASMRSKILGIFNMMMPLGMIVGVVLGGYLSANFGGWRTPFYIFAIPGMILGIIAFFLRDYKTVDNGTSKEGQGFFKDAGTLLKIPTLKWLYLGYGLHNFMIYAVLAWIPALFIRTLGIAEDKAGMITGLVAIASVIGAPLGGFITDAWQKKNGRARLFMPMIANVLSVIAIILGMLALYFKLFTAAFIIIGVWGLGSVLAIGAVNAASQDVVTPNFRGTAWGLAIFFMYVLGGWSPFLIGVISDAIGGGATGLQIAIGIASALSIPAVLLFWLGSRHYLADMEKVKNAMVVAE
jgi:MFS family permease